MTLLIRIAVVFRSLAIAFGENLVEIGLAGKAAGIDNLLNGHIGRAKQFLRMLNANGAYVLGRCHLQCFLNRPV